MQLSNSEFQHRILRKFTVASRRKIQLCRKATFYLAFELIVALSLFTQRSILYDWDVACCVLLFYIFCSAFLISRKLVSCLLDRGKDSDFLGNLNLH